MRLHSKAQRRGQDFDLNDADLRFMGSRAAPFTHPIGNLRYHEYWFTVMGHQMLAMGVIGENCDYARVSFTDAVDCTFCDGTMRTATSSGIFS